MFALPMICAALLLLSPAAAAAEPLIDLQMRDYFAGEKAQAYVFLGSGLASLGASVYLFTRDRQLARGASYAVFVGGMLNVAVAVGLFATTDARVRERSEQIARDPGGFKRDELARMDGVSARFGWAEVIELMTIAVGVGLVAWGELKRDPTMTGVGIGVATEALLLLGLDFLADQRADRYLDALRSFAPVVSQHSVHLQWFARF